MDESCDSGDMEWINLAQNKDKWLDVVNIVMNLSFIKSREFLDW
jgi:hypothetical protein